MNITFAGSTWSNNRIKILTAGFHTMVLFIFVCMLSSSVVSNSLRPHRLQPTRLLCPWDFPGKNTEVGCHFLLQGIFPTQGSNPCLLHWQVASIPLRHLGSPGRLLLGPDNFLCGDCPVHCRMFSSTPDL